MQGGVYDTAGVVVVEGAIYAGGVYDTAGVVVVEGAIGAAG